jgi:hypothetical protein
MSLETILAKLPPASPETELASLADQIKAAYAAIGEACKDVVNRAIVMGDLLNQAKQRVGHGNWAGWLQDNCSLSERTAQRYMNIADNKQKIAEHIRSQESKSATMASLTLSQVAGLISNNSNSGNGDPIAKSITSFFKLLNKQEPDQRKAVAKQMHQRLKDAGYL